MNRNLKWLKGPELKNKDGKQFQWRISAYESLFLKDGTTLFVTGGYEVKENMYDFESIYRIIFGKAQADCLHFY